MENTAIRQKGLIENTNMLIIRQNIPRDDNYSKLVQQSKHP